MKFCKIKLSEIMVQQFVSKLPEKVRTVEKLNDPSRVVYRIHIKNLDTPAYILKDEKEEIRGLHWCENNENGSNCTHLSVMAAIAYRLGMKIDKVSINTKLDELEKIDKDLSGNGRTWVSMNSFFGLLEEVEEPTEETENVPATPAIATKKSVPSLAHKRDWKAGWNEIKTYLEEQNCSVSLITKVQQRRQEIADTVAFDPMMIQPRKPSLPYHGDMLQRAIRHILNGKDLLLVGGKGTGKDTLISTLSWIFGLPVTIHVGNKDETKESIVGEPAFRNGESTFEKSQFAKTVENGGIANIAEINMLLGDVTSIYHSLLDENGVLSSPVGSIPRHPHFIMIGTMNVGEGYAGVRELNDAFKDRFAILRMPYTTDFKTMITQKTGLHDRHALMFLEKIKKAIDKLIIEESQGYAANTLRGYIDAARYFVEYGVTYDTKIEVIEDYIINKIEDLDEYMAARHMIREEGWKDFPISPEEDEYMKGGL